MNWKDHEETLFPSLEEGWPRRSSQMQRYLKLGAAGEVKQLLQQRSDLPRCALFKVARHLFKGRSVPSSKEGNRPLSHILPFIHTFEAAGESKTSTLIRPFGPRYKKGRPCCGWLSRENSGQPVQRAKR